MSRRSAWGFESGDEHWDDRAACRGKAPAMDTTDLVKAARLIKQHCHACPVIADCGQEAADLADGSGKLTDVPGKPWGIWGGQVWHDGNPRDAPIGTWRRPQCGTAAGERAHEYHDEPVCSPCFAARREQKRAQNARGKGVAVA